MSGPLTPIAPDQLKFVPVPTDFAGLAADSLSSVDNLLAAIDSDLTAAAQIVFDSINLINTMDADLSDASVVLLEMTTDTFDSILGDLSSVSDAADSMIGGGDVGLPIGSFFNPNL